MPFILFFHPELRFVIRGIKAYPLLAGVQGAKPSDVGALVDTILEGSRLVYDFPQIEEFVRLIPRWPLKKGRALLLWI
ncbi:MAG: acetate--CoA ligase family protein [Euryarchaeota archaeon]|nr:acetate--CoA ligase family protein [Euryarchaeota archaeon]